MKLIEEIVEVLEYIKSNSNGDVTKDNISKLRIAAAKKVAKSRDIKETSVTNQFRRGLMPSVNNTEEFNSLVYEYLAHKNTKLFNILISRSDEAKDRDLVRKIFTEKSLPSSAYDLEIPGTKKKEQTILRTIRDSSLAKEIKERNNYRCEICNQALELANGNFYAEAHHIKPLSKDGPDTVDNMICVCPNHHALLDFGAIRLNHNNFPHINAAYIKYHNDELFWN